MRRVEIVAASAGWPAAFRLIGSDLREALGTLAVRIDHIGSTSVPNLASKDVIDVQVTVTALDADLLIPSFGEAGFEHQPEHLRRDHLPPGVNGPEEDWTKLFFSPVSGKRPANIHVRVAGRANQRYALLFRDYLRAHPSSAAAYAELKRRLGSLDIDGRVYADVKDPVSDLIMVAAEDWAKRGNWVLGPSDA